MRRKVAQPGACLRSRPVQQYSTVNAPPPPPLPVSISPARPLSPHSRPKMKLAKQPPLAPRRPRRLKQSLNLRPSLGLRLRSRLCPRVLPWVLSPGGFLGVPFIAFAIARTRVLWWSARMGRGGAGDGFTPSAATLSSARSSAKKVSVCGLWLGRGGGHFKYF